MTTKIRSWHIILPPLSAQFVGIFGLVVCYVLAQTDMLILAASISGVLVANVNVSNDMTNARLAKVDITWLWLLALVIAIIGFIMALVLPLYLAIAFTYMLIQCAVLLMLSFALGRHSVSSQIPGRPTSSR